MDILGTQLATLLIGCPLIALAGWLLLKTLRDPAYGALLLFFFLPFERIPSFEVADITIRINYFIGGLTLLSWLVAVIMRRRRIEAQPIAPLVFLFIAALFVAIPGAQNGSRAIIVSIFTLFTISLCLVIPQLITRQADLKKILNFVGLASVVAMVFGFYQFFGDLAGLPNSITGLDPGYSQGVFGFPRIQSVGNEPLFFGNFLLLPLSLSLAFLVLPQRWFSRGKLWIFFTFLLITLALTLSRGAIIAFIGIGVFFLVLLAPRLINLRNILVFAISGVLVIGSVGGILSMISPGATDRFISHLTIQDFGKSDSTAGRLQGWVQALDLWSSSPLVGIGPGNYGPAILDYPAATPTDGWPVVNNEYIEILTEMGIVGFGFFLIFLLAMLARSFRVMIIPSLSPEIRAVVVGLTATVFGMLIQYNFFSTLYMVPVWLTFGFLIAAQNIALARGTEKKADV